MFWWIFRKTVSTIRRDRPVSGLGWGETQFQIQSEKLKSLIRGENTGLQSQSTYTQQSPLYLWPGSSIGKLFSNKPWEEIFLLKYFIKIELKFNQLSPIVFLKLAPGERESWIYYLLSLTEALWVWVAVLLVLCNPVLSFLGTDLNSTIVRCELLRLEW